MNKTVIITDEFTKKYKNKTVNWGFGGLGYIVYKRTYARKKDNDETEEWYETIQRCINGAQKIGANYTKDEAERLFDYMFDFKCIYPGRMLWQLGTTAVEKFGGNSLLNCWFVSIQKIEDFCFILENLMLGGGVGYSVRREDIYQLPKVKKDVSITLKNTKDADFICPDSREGWVNLLQKILESHFLTGKSFSYSTILIRGAGEPIKGFGGTASGPKILVDGITSICQVLKDREGKRVRSVDVLDICNIIGSIVVSGNVRRSAQISLGDPDDVLFLKAKRWDLGNIPNWRSMSNNTIYADNYDHIMETVWDGYGGNGEAYGFFNLDLSQNFGRLGEKRKDNCIGLNPCGEVTLASYENCNLAELFLNNIDSKSELVDCAKLLYKTQKAVSALSFIHEETNKIVRKNMRLGLSVTGVCQSMEKLEWLDDCYNKLREFDSEWSKKNNYPESIKITTVKPSGTVSLLGNATPGVHPAYDRFYLRRIRMSSRDGLIEVCKNLGYHTEYLVNFDGSFNHDTVVVTFPCKADSKTIIAKEMSAIRQLEVVKQLQTCWSDNAVSATVYYKKEDLPEIKAWLKQNYKSSIKSISFLLHQDHGFAQAPYESITEEKYNEMIKKVKPLDTTVIKDSNGYSIDSVECINGACPIK